MSAGWTYYQLLKNTGSQIIISLCLTSRQLLTKLISEGRAKLKKYEFVMPNDKSWHHFPINLILSLKRETISPQNCTLGKLKHLPKYSKNLLLPPLDFLISQKHT